MPKLKLDTELYEVLKGCTYCVNVSSIFDGVDRKNPGDVKAAAAQAVRLLNIGAKPVAAVLDGAVNKIISQAEQASASVKDVRDFEQYVSKCKNALTGVMLSYASEIEAEKSLAAVQSERISFKGMTPEECKLKLTALIERLRESNTASIKCHYAVSKEQVAALSGISSETCRDMMGRPVVIALQTVPKQQLPVARKLNLKFAQMDERNSRWMKDPLYRARTREIYSQSITREDKTLSMGHVASIRQRHDLGRGC